MRWINYTMTTVLIISMAAFTGCGDKASDKIEFGTLENGTYRNEFFDMTVKIPNDWSAIDNEASKL